MLLSSSSFESGANPPGRARLLFELQHGGDAAGGLRAGGAAGGAESGGERRRLLSTTESSAGPRRAARGQGSLSVCPPASPSVRLWLHRSL